MKLKDRKEQVKRLKTKYGENFAQMILGTIPGSAKRELDKLKKGKK